ncbi:MAG TPA: glyceraldehyde-3-phosphate dehydrogenase [Bacteroidales bacterium]|jgi:glyceraldehyde 3-phosphate dehydrogenase|nr:glyceraldehyde-3-phosphate dehydrogenase [Bacteroidales bacterium]HNQ82332.1 glyceraldehyde-3-phosphate dehydrogenase [Bacteroidales bacterium]HOX77416.1 glyceraldehyde-3-phosphate dehydrogenase [Bacteroidales bacterium]
MSESSQSKKKEQFHEYVNSLENWITDEKSGFEFVNLVGQLYYDKSIELIIFRSQLIDRSSSVILKKHQHSLSVLGKELKIQVSVMLAKELLSMDIPPARIDIGRLNKEWTEEGKNYLSPRAFLQDKLKNLLGKKAGYDKPVDVIVYGFGRIGRLVTRELIIQGNGTQLNVKAVVTRGNSPEEITKRASLFKNDSIHGPFRGVAIEDHENKLLLINGHKVKMLSANNPEDIDYEAEGIHNALLIDSTGVWTKREDLARHLKAKGVSKVMLTAPAKGDVPNIVYGVNHDDGTVDYKTETIYSAASCTTNAIVPILYVIENRLGIDKGHIETIHAYTNDQNLTDNYHKKPRRGRSAPMNMVLTSTGAASAAAKAIPSLKGKLTANAVRVPIPNVSLAILSLTVQKQTTQQEVVEILRDAALNGRLVEQIRFSASTEAVSTDFIGDSCAGIFDAPATLVSADGKSIILYVWYDNEFGYTIQALRLAKHIAGVQWETYY